jgi:hypothetical protein
MERLRPASRSGGEGANKGDGDKGEDRERQNEDDHVKAPPTPMTIARHRPEISMFVFKGLEAA